MIEAKIEKAFVDRLKKVLEQYNIQVVGTLQPTLFDEVKAEETKGAVGILAVKVSPREYATSTIPTCQIRGGLSLNLRADVDYSGKNYIEVCDIIMNQMERFQKCLPEVHEEFSVPDEYFRATGFQLTSGDTAVNKDAKTFQYTHGFIVFGVVSDMPNSPIMCGCGD